MEEKCIVCNESTIHGFELKNYGNCCGIHVVEAMKKYFETYPERDCIYLRLLEKGEL